MGDMTRWLDAEEQRTWRSFLTATQLLHAQLDRELQRDSGMPHAYYEILVRLSEAPARTLRMSDLADASASSRPSPSGPSYWLRGGVRHGGSLRTTTVDHDD